jgi:phosphoribosyl-AMP cyclohydrolase
MGFDGTVLMLRERILQTLCSVRRERGRNQMSEELVGRVIVPSADQLDAVTFNSDGLVPAIAQCSETGQILMMAWMNAESLSMTFAEGRMVYWSRSRQELWRKGDTSGDRQFVREAFYDCDGDTLLFVVEQEGKGACHTGERSCFYRSFGDQ